MECYRSECKVDCDKYQKAICLLRLTKEQHELIAKIRKYRYCNCGERFIRAKCGKRNIRLCTNCELKELIS